ncbi:ribbon-helix-helix protein, CopG family [Ferrimicrobium sp.]|uniref:ribbon-helix-helix protein, CopG family n=1 Tax=Ferrimicrobium sp. TaxID=2926050 RepID=UPI00261F67C7|nr:ribbon-helix-helix protein, CopG family [Ferrimicrobium sp.]
MRAPSQGQRRGRCVRDSRASGGPASRTLGAAARSFFERLVERGNTPELVTECKLSFAETMNTRTTTIRLPGTTAEALEVVARVDNQSVSEAIRQAVVEHIRMRRADPDFQQSLQDMLESQCEVFERLAEL